MYKALKLSIMYRNCSFLHDTMGTVSKMIYILLVKWIGITQ